MKLAFIKTSSCITETYVMRIRCSKTASSTSFTVEKLLFCFRKSWRNTAMASDDAAASPVNFGLWFNKLPGNASHFCFLKPFVLLSAAHILSQNVLSTYHKWWWLRASGFFATTYRSFEIRGEPHTAQTRMNWVSASDGTFAPVSIEWKLWLLFWKCKKLEFW